MHRIALVVVVTLLLAPAVAAAAPPAKPGVVLVRPSGSRGSSSLAKAPQVAGTIASLPGGVRAVAVRGDAGSAATALRRKRGIRWAEPDYLVHATAAPNDPRFGEQTDFAAIGALPGWTALGLGAFPGSGGVPVGIVDTGIDGSHPDFAGRVQACAAATSGKLQEAFCSDGEGHGTHVAGTIGAAANNGVGIAGLAFASPLIVCRALGPDGAGDVASIAACLRWVHDQGAKVISLSLGGPASQTLAAAVKDAYARGGKTGSLIVAAAGNDGDGQTEYPAGLTQVVSVGATDDRDGHAEFSNVNADVEISAPGVDVLSAAPGGRYVRLSGTSMATPHVSAAAALIWATKPAMTASAVRRRLDAAVVDLGARGRDPVFGFGRLDMTRLVAAGAD